MIIAPKNYAAPPNTCMGIACTAAAMPQKNVSPLPATRTARFLAMLVFCENRRGPMGSSCIMVAVDAARAPRHPSMPTADLHGPHASRTTAASSPGANLHFPLERSHRRPAIFHVESVAESGDGALSGDFSVLQPRRDAQRPPNAIAHPNQAHSNCRCRTIHQNCRERYSRRRFSP